jgi:competence protein ComFA
LQIARSIYPYLAGRSLLFDEIEKICLEAGISLPTTELLQVLSSLEESGLAEQIPAVSHSPWAIRRRCERCDAGPHFIEVSKCARCGNNSCAYCTRCLLLGRAKSCTLLFRFQPVVVQPEEMEEKVFPLLAAQQKTVTKLNEWLASSEQMMTLLVVPGAGKVAMLTPVLQAIVQEGKRIFWCRKREHIALLVKRLSLLLPVVGGEGWGRNNQITVGTSWELIRFYQQFDLIVVDGVEVPSSETVKRSLNQRGKVLTITPSMPRRHVSPFVVHPIRKHAYPLPVPIFIHNRKLWRAIQQKKQITELSLFVERVKKTNGQALFVVPRDEDEELVMNWLESVLPKVAAETGRFNRGQDYKAIQQLFSEQKLTFMLLPQQLVYPIRVAKLHLCVLGADHMYFCRHHLVELSYHVGKSAIFPSGDVWFIGEERTEIIMQAKKEIKYLNDLAKKEGYL